uniref:Uncharacterized protein n=1 Tax=Anopheles atroparvus TaxID=41427 RepID=A0A182J7P5_ANOAO
MSIGVNLRVTGHTSIGGRKYQEDYFSVAYQQTENDQNLEYAYFGIYDGHGGAEASLYAKEHLMNTIVSQKQFWSENDEDVLKSIREGYIQTHYSMWREQDKWPKTSSGLPSTAGTTASIAFIRRGKIYIGHVGDSGIVLGYQKDKEAPHDDDGRWVASPLTEDHKPESYAEKMRIMSCGGKVVTKSGVPRVVWNRPRIGHKGPVRRSTPIDEIPFLAVARSLGDLWSYNSAVDEFIVSPVPDVSVIEIDPKKFRCLIFGTDGLWNVISPKSAVEIVRATEMENIRIALEGGSEWKNPSKLLVNEALERWSRSNMKADNTSVVIIMLDPPGPPKRDVLKSVKNSIQHASSDCRSAASGATGSDMYDLYDCITRGDGGSVLPEMAASRSNHSDAPSLRYLHHHHHHHHQHNYQHHRSYHEPVQQSVHHHHHHHIHHRDPAEHYGSDPSHHLEHHHQTHHHNPEQYCHPGASTSYHADLAYTDTSFAESYNSLLDRSFENTDHSYTTMFHPTTDDGTGGEGSATSAYHNLATLVEANPTEDDEEALIDYLPESDDETAGGDAETMGGRRDSTYSLTNLQTKSERLRAAMVESEGSHHSHPPYYHHHPQHRRGDEEEAGGCYSGGNLAIIEHFHNYHQHQYGGATAGRSSIHAGPLEEHHQSMYQMELTPQYHHQGGVTYQPNHFQQCASTSSSSSQMERYDYRQPSTNNNLLGCEPSGGSLSKEKPDHEFGYSSEYQDDDDVIIQQPEEEMDMGEQRLSGDVRHIQINEISSSYAGGTPSTVSIGLLSASDSEGAGSSSGCASGDEENNASSTTQQLVVVPALATKRERTLKKPPSTSARVITIFYETRSNSRRRPRIRTAPSPAGGAGSTRSLLGVAKRRRTTTTAAVVRSAIATPNPTLTLERRVLRSNGMNTTGRALGASTVSRPMQTLVRAPDPPHQPKLVVNNFAVSSTTLEGKPASSHLCTRRTKLDESGTGKRNTLVATLVRTEGGVVAVKHKSTADMGPRKAPANPHQPRTMLLRRTTQ